MNDTAEKALRNELEVLRRERDEAREMHAQMCKVSVQHQQRAEQAEKERDEAQAELRALQGEVPLIEELEHARQQRDEARANLVTLLDHDSDAHDDHLIDCFRRGCVTSKSVLKAALDRAEKAEKERDEALMANVCDACLGKPLPAGGLCMCGGTGFMSDAARFLRERVVKLTRERDEAREEVETWVKTYETTHADVLRLAKERDEYRALYEAVSGTSKRDIAERQRELCAERVKWTLPQAAEVVRATPLVMDGGGE